MVANKKSKKAARQYALEHGVPYRQARREESGSFVELDPADRVVDLLRESVSLSDMIGHRVVSLLTAEPGDFLAVPLPDGTEHGFVSGFELMHATVGVEVQDPLGRSTPYRAKVDNAIIRVTVPEESDSTVWLKGQQHRYRLELHYVGTLDHELYGGYMPDDRLEHLKYPRLTRVDGFAIAT